MNTFRPGLILVLVCCALLVAAINGGRDAVTFSATLEDAAAETGKMSSIAGNGYVPRDASEVLQASHRKYLESCMLFQAGESERARDAFNAAVDLLLTPDWDAASSLHLNHFFQEMMQRIPGGQAGSPVDGSGPELFLLEISPSLGDEFDTARLADGGYGIPISVNRMVVRSLYYWLNDGGRFFADGLKRSGQYRPIIERIFREESVPLDLMYLAQVESLFKPTAFSKARAKGIWQFNTSTALQYGLCVAEDIDERSDPEKSTRAAARYLKDLYRAFGDWNLALAAYNWGGARVKRLMQETGVRDFWALARAGGGMPNETRNHVPLIHASIILAHNAEIFELPTELDPYVEYVEISVPRPVDLCEVARILDITVEEIRRLNPALTASRTPAGYPGFRLKIPAGSDVHLRERLATLAMMSEKYS